MYCLEFRRFNSGIIQASPPVEPVACWAGDDDADLERLTRQGFKAVTRAKVGERGRFIYCDTHYHPGKVIELFGITGPRIETFCLIREAAKAGSAPIRFVPFPT